MKPEDIERIQIDFTIARDEFINSPEVKAYEKKKEEYSNSKAVKDEEELRVFVTEKLSKMFPYASIEYYLFDAPNNIITIKVCDEDAPDVIYTCPLDIFWLLSAEEILNHDRNIGYDADRATSKYEFRSSTKYYKLKDKLNNSLREMAEMGVVINMPDWYLKFEVQEKEAKKISEKMHSNRYIKVLDGY